MFRGDAYKQKGDNGRATADYAKVMERLNEGPPYPDVVSLIGSLIIALILFCLRCVDSPRKGN